MMGNREQLLRDIGIADFMVTELVLFLDTHPGDCNAMEYFNHYNRIKNQMEKEFSQKYFPLNVARNGAGGRRLCPGKESVVKCGVMRKDWSFP